MTAVDSGPTVVRFPQHDTGGAGCVHLLVYRPGFNALSKKMRLEGHKFENSNPCLSLEIPIDRKKVRCISMSASSSSSFSSPPLFLLFPSFPVSFLPVDHADYGGGQRMARGGSALGTDNAGRQEGERQHGGIFAPPTPTFTEVLSLSPPRQEGGRRQATATTAWGWRGARGRNGDGVQYQPLHRRVVVASPSLATVALKANGSCGAHRLARHFSWPTLASQPASLASRMASLFDLFFCA